MRVDFCVRAEGESAAVAAAVGVCGGVQDYARSIQYSRKHGGHVCSITDVPDGVSVWIYVFRRIGDHWVLRGGGATGALGHAWSAIRSHTLAGSPENPGDEAPAPVILARYSRANAAAPPQTMPDYTAELMQYAQLARRELVESVPWMVAAPPMLAYTLHGVVPVGATFQTPMTIPETTLRALVSLMCHLDKEPVELETLAAAGDEVVARVLARVALVANTIRYIPDEALAINADYTAGPDGDPAHAPGTIPTNTFTDASMTWTDDCEGDVAITVAIWRALRAADIAELRPALAKYRMVILATSIAGAALGSYHMCAALLGPRPALVESVVRTAGVPTNPRRFTPPLSEDDRRRERPLVRTGQTLNEWYGNIAFALDASDPLTVLLPSVDQHPGGSLAQLLDGKVAFEPMVATVRPDVRRAIEGAVAVTPRTDLSERRLTVVPGRAGLAGTAMIEDGRADAYIRVTHPSPGVPAKVFAFEAR